jgi:hypothetical protein
VPAPNRSEHELYAAVQERAAVIRRRRRAGISAGLGGVVAVLLLAFALVGSGEDRASELRVVGEETTTTSVVVVVPTTVAPLPSTTVPPPPVTTPATRRATVPSSTTPTTQRPTTSVAPTTVAPTTSTIPPPLRSCDPGDVVVTATSERPSYPVGATVSIIVAAQNRSSRACQPLDPSLEFRNAAGVMLFGMGMADIFTMGIPGQPQPSWDPGETLSTTMPAPLWCGDSHAPCPPGTYSATAIFGPFRSPPATFSVT